MSIYIKNNFCHFLVTRSDEVAEYKEPMLFLPGLVITYLALGIYSLYLEP